MVNSLPADYPRVSAALCVDGAADSIDFYRSIFGFAERMRLEDEGKVGHSEITLGESLIMVSDEYPDIGVVGPQTVGGSPVFMHIYVEDVEATFASATSAGAKELRPIENKFYGDRSGMFEDPWGHRWSVASHVEDVDPEDMGRLA